MKDGFTSFIHHKLTPPVGPQLQFPILYAYMYYFTQLTNKHNKIINY